MHELLQQPSRNTRTGVHAVKEDGEETCGTGALVGEDELVNGILVRDDGLNERRGVLVGNCIFAREDKGRGCVVVPEEVDEAELGCVCCVD